MPAEAQHLADTKVGFVSAAGAGTQYAVTKLQLDTIYDHARHMPDPGRLLQPFAWAAVGVAVTAAAEAYNSHAGTEHRHLYAVTAIAAGLIWAACLFADAKIKTQGHRHAHWLMRYMDGIYDQCDLEPPKAPAAPPSPWKRVRGDSAKRT
jgi:hypothetical protein